MDEQPTRYENKPVVDDGAPQQAQATHHKRQQLPIILLGVALLIVICAGMLLLHVSHHHKTATISSTVNGTQLARLLPNKTAVPSGWTFGSVGTTGSTNLHGFYTPIPLGQCSYIGGLNGIGVLLGIRSEQAYASETDTQYSSSDSPQAGLPVGTLTMTLAELLPDTAPTALTTVEQWIKNCPSWKETDLGISYTASIATVPGLGQQAIDIHAIPQAGSSGYATEILVVQTTNRRLVIITDTTQIGGTAANPAAIAGPLVSKFKQQAH